MKIEELLKLGIEKLQQAEIENPAHIARILCAKVLNISKEYILIHDKEEVSEKNKETYVQAIEKIINGIPMQYVTNHQEFMKLDLYVDENVLIPRADTEILVEEVIELAKYKKNIEILDMCTGSGAIAISCAKYIKNSKVTALDYSIKAIEVAKKNATNCNVNIDFIHSNMFEKLENVKYDIIVSNPPYIQTSVIDTLQKQVQKEPKMALDGGEDGLDFYRILANNAYKFLKKDGYLCLEIGYDQKMQVINLLEETNQYTTIYSKKDLYNNDRIVIAKKAGDFK